MMISALLALGAVSIPLIVVPYRRARGLPTYQWDGTAANPVRLRAICGGGCERRQRRQRGAGARALERWKREGRLVLRCASYRHSRPAPPTPSPAQYLHDFAEEQERHTFDDPRLLAAWSKRAAYRCVLRPPSPLACTARLFVAFHPPPPLPPTP